MKSTGTPNPTAKKIKDMPYVEFMALINEVNRPPGGRDSLREIALNTFLDKSSHVLHIGCSTGSSTRQISSLTGCKAIGIDISEPMIKTAKNMTTSEKLSNRVKFFVGDAQNLKFNKNSFNLVLSAGSVAFMKDRSKVLSEVVRVLKDYGFFADIPMFYYKNPPKNLIEEMNSLMKIKIQNWGKEFWEKQYSHPNLELIYTFDGKFKVPSKKQVESYCDQMSKDNSFSQQVQTAIKKRLTKLMGLFAKNHKYLSYSVLIYQKVPKRDQTTLFGK